MSMYGIKMFVDFYDIINLKDILIIIIIWELES